MARGTSGSCPIQQSWAAALVFCCFAARPQTGSFLIGHSGAPQKTVKKKKALHVFDSDQDWHAIGWFNWPRWSADDKLYLIPSFSRETPCQKVIIVSKPRASPEVLLPGNPHTTSRTRRTGHWRCYGRVSFVRSRSNVLSAHVSNFLTVFFILGKSCVFCGETGK